MEAYRSGIVLACVTLYMVTCALVGLWAMRRTRSSHDFFMAGRNLGVIVTGVAVFSSTMSGFGFVGGPGLVYRMGMSSLWMVVCTPIGYAISFFLLAKRIRIFAEVCDSVSLPDVVAARYRSETSRLLTALAILLGVLGYLATQILAMATVLGNIIASSEWLGNWSLGTCVAVSCAVLVFYCVTGGIIASVYTDLVQGCVMVIAAVLVFFAALAAIDYSPSQMSAVVAADDPEAIGPWGTLGIMGALSWYFLFALGGVGQPHVVTKLMMNRSVRDARHILPLSVLGYTLTALLWISIGLVMRTLVLQGDYPELATSNDAAPAFLQNYAHPLLAGVVFAGLFAAIMSTADAFLNIGAAAVVHDIPRALMGRSLRRELLWARVGTLALAVVAAIVALTSGELVALLGARGWGTFAAATVPAVAIGFNWKRGTALAANVSIAVSLLINFSPELITLLSSGSIVFQPPHGIHIGAVSLLVSLTLFVGISLASKRPKLDPEIAGAMEL